MRVGRLPQRRPEDEVRRGETPTRELRYALSEGVWDVAKLALAIAERQASFSYIVAGAREKTWSAGGLGTELFDSADHAMADLRDDAHASLWASWKRKGDPVPLRLPRIVRITAVKTVDLELLGEQWQLRCASVDAEPRQMADVDDHRSSPPPGKCSTTRR